MAASTALSRARAGLLAVAGLLVTLAITHGLDRLIYFLRQQNSQSPSEIFGYVLMWTYFLGSLLTAALLLGLFWWLMARLPRLAWVGWLYLLVGLLISAYPVLIFPPVGAFVTWLSPVSIQGYYYHASGLLALTGLAVLLRRNSQIKGDAA